MQTSYQGQTKVLHRYSLYSFLWVVEFGAEPRNLPFTAAF